VFEKSLSKGDYPFQLPLIQKIPYFTIKNRYWLHFARLIIPQCLSPFERQLANYYG